MKKIYCALLSVILISVFSTGLFAQVPPTTRTLQWAVGSKNWPTVGASNNWDNKANWINTATGLAPTTNVTDGDKLIIPTTGSPVISITASMSITFTNLILEVQGNGLIDLARGVDLNMSNAGNNANNGINLVGVAAGKGLTLQKSQGANNTSITMNGKIKALNTSNSTALAVPAGSSHARGSDALVATITGFGGFSGGTLPVVLTSFDANLTGASKVEIKWTTQQEVNADYFDIQKSSDGINWSSIGTVKATGYSSNPHSYSYTDNNPSAGANFYRVRINDLDGKYGFTPVRNVRLDIAGKISLYPNPATDVLNISLGKTPSADWSVAVFNNSGQVVINKKFNKNTTTVSLPVNTYGTGNYMLKITDGSSVQTSKFIISHH